MGLLSWFRRGPSPENYLADRRRMWPLQIAPAPEGDLAEIRFRYLLPRIPPEIRELAEHDGLAVAEIGQMSVDAFTTALGPRAFTIEMYTGVSRFLYRVSRVMHTLVRVFENGRVVAEPSIAVEQTVSTLEAVFRNYMATKKIQGPDYQISKDQIELASELASAAETFVIAHEIGHVAMFLRDGIHGELTPAQELEADALAVGYVLIGNGQSDGTGHLRMAYAGVEFASRVFACLQHLDYPFNETHPPPAQRLTEIRNTARRLLGDARYNDISTIATAHDQLLESLEVRFSGRQNTSFAVGLTPERLVSALSVVIEQLAKEISTLDFAVREITNLFTEAGEATVRTAVTEAARRFRARAQGDDAGQDGALAILEYAAFVQVAEEIAQPWREILHTEIYRST